MSSSNADMKKAAARRAVKRLGELHAMLSAAGLMATANDGVICLVDCQTGEVLAALDIPALSVSQSSPTNL